MLTPKPSTYQNQKSETWMIPTLELSKEARTDAIASIRRYFAENLSEPIGELAAGLLLNFFLEEIGPIVYNRAIADAQHRMEQRAADLTGELFFPEFQYWPRVDSKKKNKRDNK